MSYEGLTRCVNDKEIELALCESLSISEDETLYRFTLKEATWSNQEPITAFDFERSWKELLKKKGPCSFLFYPIQNVEKYMQNKASLKEVGIRAINDRLFEVKLEKKTPYFYSLTAFPSFLAAPDEKLFSKSVFSGPFLIEKMVPQREIILKKNPYYHDAKKVKLSQIHISIVPDEMTAFHMFEQKHLDWIGSSLSPLPLDIIENASSSFQKIEMAASTFCTFHTQSFPFSNTSLRRAFSLAINRKEIVEKIIPHQIEPTSFLPPCFSQENHSLFHPEKALDYFKKGLEELNIEAKDLNGISLYFRAGQVEKRVALAIQKQWKDLFDIEINLISLDFKSHAQRLQRGKYQIALSSFIAQFMDPMSIFDRFKYKENLKNYPKWESKLYQELLLETNTEKRNALFQKAEKILTEEAPLTPIYHWSSFVLFHPKVKKAPTSACGGVLFERFEVEP